MTNSLQIQLKTLAEEMQAISKGLEKVEQELIISENDGPVSETFCKVCKHINIFHVLGEFISVLLFIFC